MKIGIDIRTLMDERYSGVSEFTLNLILNILKLDHQNEYRLFYNSAKDIEHRLPKFGQPNVCIIRRRFPNKIFNYILQKFLSYPKVDRLLEADVFFSPHMNFLALSGKGVSILAVHDLSFLVNPEYFSRRKNIWHRMLNLKKLVNKYDKIVAVSENTKEDVIRFFNVSSDKVEVIYPGIGGEFTYIERGDEQLAKIKIKYGLPENFILFLGTIEPRKNILAIIKSFEQLIERNKNLEEYVLVIAGGDGWKNDDIYRAWEESAYKQKIKFLGYVDKNDKVYLYNSAKIFIYPSFYEGFGFPPLEAMACGLPVIVSYSSSLPEICGDACLMINPCDVNELSLAMEELILKEKVYGIYKERGLEQAKKFNWQRTAKSYIEILNKTKMSL